MGNGKERTGGGEKLDLEILLGEILRSDRPVKGILELTRNGNIFELSDNEMETALKNNNRLALVWCVLPSIAKECQNYRRYLLNPDKLFDRSLILLQERIHSLVEEPNKSDISKVRLKLFDTRYIDGLVTKAYGVPSSDLFLIDACLEYRNEFGPGKDCENMISGIRVRFPHMKITDKKVEKIWKRLVRFESKNRVVLSAAMGSVFEELNYLLITLPSREAEILRKRFVDGLTIEEVAKDMGLTNEVVRQIEKRALRGL